MEKGFVQVYTGNGKGKTTAAFGLALRAVGAGLKVLIIQFIKKGDYSEIAGIRALGDGIRIEQYGAGRFVTGSPTRDDQELAGKGLARAREALESGAYDVIILDELNVALAKGLIPLPDVLKFLDENPGTVEIICTGRNAPAELCDRADLVTEMREVKHYLSMGIHARKGIEK